MVSPHLLRPFSSRQLSLVSGDGRVMVFASLGGRWQGPTTEVHGPTLARRITDLPGDIDTVVFIDEPVPDGVTVGLIDDMVHAFDDHPADILVRYVPATEAVKRVDGPLVVEGIDRSRLVAVRAPEVISREAMANGISALGNRLWVNPTALAASTGAVVGLYEHHHSGASLR